MPDASCPLDGCPYPDLGCNLGHADPPSECAPYRRGVTVTTVTPRDEAAQLATLPWTGGALGSADLSGISTLTRPRVIGVVGLSDAGKSSALSTLYLLLTRGHALRDRTFAGSRTLFGWEALASPGRWPPSGTGPSFPEHTTSLARVPGLLHLAFRRGDGHREDVLLTDAPGEWFKDWARTASAPTAEGARWVAKHADGAVLFIDSDALTGPGRGAARAQLVPLIRRTAEAFCDRPVVVVWSKSDVKVPQSMRDQIESQLEQHLPESLVLATTVRPPEWNTGAVRGLFTVFEAVLDGSVTQRTPSTHPVPALPFVDADDPFLSFRGRVP